MTKILPKDVKKQKILFSALNWGYGHIMRSLVLLEQFTTNQNEVIVVCTVEQEQLIISEGHKYMCIVVPGYPFKFTKTGSFDSDILFGSARLRKYMKWEQQQVEIWCKQFEINLVISDQSMGFYSNKTTSILVTHQINLPLKFWQKPAQIIYNKWLKNFDAIWIPDNPPPNNLAGKLSNTSRKNVIYIGWLSRFKTPCYWEKTYDFGALITGPEPYAREFFEYCKKRFLIEGGKCFIIYNGETEKRIDNIEIFDHQNTEKMSQFLCSAKKLITRCGYSTLMDLQVLGFENVELHATKGQREQEYLLKHKKGRLMI